MTTLFLDTETYSETPLAAGVHRYAEDPFAEIMIETYAIDDGPVVTVDRTAGEPSVWTLFDPEDFDAIVMHESMFDRTMFRVVDGVDIPVHIVHDTAVQARSHGLPGGLDKLCAIFRVPDALAKHKEGRSLIQRFCKPQPKTFKLHRATRHTHPDEWQRFLSYAGNDILAMRYLKGKLPTWNYPNREHPLWCLDQAINDRGFCVDTELAQAAIAMIDEIKAQSKEDVSEMTDGRVGSVMQRDALLEELLLEHHVRLPDMTQSTLEKRMEDPDLPEAAKALIGQRLMISATSTAKYQKVMSAVCDDGRLHGTLLFCGAPRTKRDAGRLFQPQNLPRPDMPVEAIERTIQTIKAGLGTTMLDEPMRAAWNALRGLVVADKGKKIVQADFSQIEARVLPWLAQEEWKLQAFRDYDVGIGPDLYRVGAARILNLDIDQVTKPIRQMYGKVPELACGYGGSVGAFRAMASTLGMDIPAEHEIKEIVDAWRERNQRIASWQDGLWVTLENAARSAVQSPGKVFEAGPYIRFEKWRNWLRMELPSGGYLSYADPHFFDHSHGGPNSLCFWGVNSYTRKWERLYTYGGKLSADATQATARELFAYNWQHVEDQGFPIVLRCHDELLTEPIDDPEFSVDKLVAAFTRRPPWIDDKLPISADGWETQRYGKLD